MPRRSRPPLRGSPCRPDHGRQGPGPGEGSIRPDLDAPRCGPHPAQQALRLGRGLSVPRRGRADEPRDDALDPAEHRKGDPLPQESREKVETVVVDAFVGELRRSDQFEGVDEVGPGTLLVRGAVLDIVSWVPPTTSRVDAYLAALGEGAVIFELIDAETGLMQARLGQRMYIRPPELGHDFYSRPANLNTVWPDVDRWARGVAADLRRELEDRLEKADGDR